MVITTIGRIYRQEEFGAACGAVSGLVRGINWMAEGCMGAGTEGFTSVYGKAGCVHDQGRDQVVFVSSVEGYPVKQLARICGFDL